MKAPIALIAALLLTGCYAAPTTPRLADPVAEQPAMGAAGTKVSVSTARAAAACPDPVGVLTGHVLDQDRKAAGEGARIEVLVAGAAAPEFTVTVIGGAYAVSQLPVGVELEVRAVSKTGFVRARKLTLAGAVGCDDAESLRVTLNFGGPATAQDPTSHLNYLPR